MEHPPQRLATGLCDRRSVLKIGSLLPLGLPLAAATAFDSSAGPARRCILIWLDGGPSHLETFDPKPAAPSEVRGPLGVAQTTVSGVHFADQLPRMAKLAGKLAVIRSLTSPLGEHNLGTHYMMTGYKPTPVLEHPVIASVMAHQHPDPKAILPSHVAVPDFRVGGARLSGHGFLPASLAPFGVGSDPARPGFRVDDLDLYTGMTRMRLDRRRRFLLDLDALRENLEAGETLADAQLESAYRLVTSSDARKAFALEEEPDSTRQKYGRRTVGQACLLARRLVERGVPFVTVNHRGWDTHTDLATRLRDGFAGSRVPQGLVPTLDQAFSALVEDLAERGLLDSTLVLVMGEFGRTPKLNTRGGRDHWPRVFSAALCGGGVRGGSVVGASDSVGESPHSRPVTPSDLAATIYQLLGISPASILHTPAGRPVRITPASSQPVAEVIGS